MGWLKDRKRRKILEEPIPPEWERVIRENIGHYSELDRDEARNLLDFVQIFVAEKSWEGCGGLEMTDEVRVTISGQVGLLVLGLPHEYFRNVYSVLVYPSTILTPDRKPGTFELPRTETRSGVPILGEAQLRGPVILVWDTVKQNARHPEMGHNVVYHEFAHKLDMLDGGVDGTPPLSSRAALDRWAEVCGAAYLELRAKLEAGKRTLLDPYAATNEAEFFAVATELFFDRPAHMEEEAPSLYGVLRDFYQQDPAARARHLGS